MNLVMTLAPDVWAIRPTPATHAIAGSDRQVATPTYPSVVAAGAVAGPGGLAIETGHAGVIRRSRRPVCREGPGNAGVRGRGRGRARVPPTPHRFVRGPAPAAVRRASFPPP